ncbi:MAG: ADP-ribosylation factor-like protein [archaeon]|nr:ADP-ribosylation factor-like protein [archaeon]
MSKAEKKNIRGDLKIIVIGTAGTGKTSFVNKWTKNVFNENYKATIVSEFGFKIVEINGKMYRIQLWDLAGKNIKN